MTVVSIAVETVGSVTEINAWLAANGDKTIERVLLMGSHWYIFYV